MAKQAIAKQERGIDGVTLRTETKTEKWCTFRHGDKGKMTLPSYEHERKPGN